MNYAKLSWVVRIVCVGWLLGLGAPAAHAQTARLSIVIETPAQGETFFVSPSAFLYSIHINGWVVTSNPEPSLIKLQLEVWRGAERTARLDARANPDGSFSFAVTANPGAADFPDPHTGCIECHFTSSIALPPGQVVVRVTATDLAGNQAIAERTVIVDHSGTALIPIQVVDADRPTQPVPNLPVLGATRLYLWRGRTSSGTTDANGLARVSVEALSQSPTRYVFNVPPAIVNGVLYESIASKTVTLKPGQAQSEPVTLQVRARRGHITGTLAGISDAPLTVRAIEANTGASFVTQARANAFVFTDLPVAAYFITLDPAELASRSFAANSAQVDLTTAPLAQTSVTLSARSASSRVVRGTIRTSSGEPVPFAWLALAEAPMARTNPATGEFVLYDVPADARTLRVIAPGFWSQRIALVNDSPVSITLVPRNTLRSMPWGEGALWIPPETLTEFIGGHLIVTHGWAWGRGTGDFALEAAGATIRFENARVAIERQAERAWVYMLEGKATVAFDAAHPSIVTAGQMLVIDARSKNLGAVAIEPLAIHALTAGLATSSEFVTEPTFDARVSEWLAQFGISIAQLVTFATYLFITLAIASAPAGVGVLWRRFKR